LLNRATRTPLANDLGDGRPANGSLLVQGVVAALYAKAYWPVLTRALKSAFGGDGTLLIELADSLMQRNSNGSYTNLADANMAINCLDRPWPPALSAWRSIPAPASKAARQSVASIVGGSRADAYWPCTC